MTNIKNILLIGVGAIGSVVASRLNDAGYTVNVLCDKARYKRYSKDNFVVNNKLYVFNYVTHSMVKTPPDIVIVATKHYALKTAIKGLDKIVGDGTIVMSLLNGIDSEEMIGNEVGAEKLIHAFIYQTDATKVNNHTVFNSAGIIAFGEKDKTKTVRLKAIAALFDATNIAYQIKDDILKEMWWKYMVNIGLNQVSAILHASYGVFLQSEQIWDLTVRAMQEAIAVAKANDVQLSKDSIDRVYTMLTKLGTDGKTSMFQDVVAKRKTELDMLAGQLLRMAKIAGVSTPVNQVLFEQLSAIESMY